MSVIYEGEYRASDRNRKWRVIQKRGYIGAESEDRTDAMGKTVFSPLKAFEVNGAASTILAHLVNMARNGEKLRKSATLPAIIASGEMPLANPEKAKPQWRLVQTKEGHIVPEEEIKRDGIGEVVFDSVRAFVCQCSAGKAIFEHLLELVSETDQ